MECVDTGTLKKDRNKLRKFCKKSKDEDFEKFLFQIPELFIALPICLSAISIDLRHVEQVLVQGRQGGHSCNCNNKSNKSLYKSWSQPQLTRENLKARVGEAFSVPASAAGTRPLARKGISLGILSVYEISTYRQHC